jgi:hypothetical protein
VQATSFLPVLGASPQIISSPTTPEDIAKTNDILIQMDLVNKIASYNIQYLAISVAVILFVGAAIIGWFYLLNVKPLQESISKYENEFKALNKGIEDKFKVTNDELRAHLSVQTVELKDSLDTTKIEIGLLKEEVTGKIKITEEFIEKIQKETKSLKDEYQSYHLEAIWNEQYMWDGQEVYLNALTSLIEYINKAIKWDKNYILDLWFKRTIKVLQQIKKDEVTIDQDKEIQLDLTKALSKIPGKETEKALITKEIERLFS